jgi:hypothetical protein
MWYIDILKTFMCMWAWGLVGLWLGTWWVRGELRLILGNEEVMGLIPVGWD